MKSLEKIEDAARHAEENSSMIDAINVQCGVTCYSRGISVNCIINDRDTGLKSASHRMISYHAVDACRANILIDALDRVIAEAHEVLETGK